MPQHEAGPDPDQALSDEAISFIRTAVPMLWGLIVSWLVGLGIPVAVLDKVHMLVVAGLTALFSAGWYALWRWLEPRVPVWLVKVVLGYAAAPQYAVAVRLDRPGPGIGPSPVSGSVSPIELPKDPGRGTPST